VTDEAAKTPPKVSLDGGDPVAGSDSELTTIGKKVREYVLDSKAKVFSSADGEPAKLNALEEGIIKVTTGYSVPGIKGAEIYALPFINKNLFRGNWHGAEVALGDRHPEAMISFGSNHPTLDQLSLVKEKEPQGGLRTFQEIGLLSERSPIGASKLGKSTAAGPLLDSMEIAPGGSRGLGLRGTATDGSFTADLQLAQKVTHPLIPVPTFNAPTKMLSLTKSGNMTGSDDAYALGGSVFTDINGPRLPHEVHKPGGDITLLLQQKYGAVTTSVTTEAMAIKGTGQMRRLEAEVSKHAGDGIVPYAGISATHAKGDALPVAATSGVSKEAKLGVAYKLKNENPSGNSVLFYCEVAAGDQVKPSLMCGFNTGAASAQVIKAGPKQK
jgi:hypothetical protein